MRDEPTNPVNNIKNPFQHENLWEDFVKAVGLKGREEYEKRHVAPEQLGMLYRVMSDGDVQKFIASMRLSLQKTYSRLGDQEYGEINETIYAMFLCSFAYSLRIKEKKVRELATALVALHHPREEIFAYILTAMFNMSVSNLGPSWPTLKKPFDLWLSTFGESALNQAQEASTEKRA